MEEEEERQRPMVAFGVPPTIELKNRIWASIDNGTHAVPRTWTAIDMEAGEVAQQLPDTVRAMATASKRFLIGTTYSDVVAAFFKGLALARESNNPIVLIRDCILAIYVAYTISSSWAPSYNAFANMSLFSGFDIASRTPGAAGKDAWVAGSTMNATAVHKLGYMLIDASGEGTFLGSIKVKKGTPFTTVVGTSEQIKLINKEAETITDDDRAANNIFRTHARKAVIILNIIFGASGVDVAGAMEAANKYRDALI